MFIASSSLGKLNRVQCRLIGATQFLSIPVECDIITAGLLESITSKFEDYVHQKVTIAGDYGMFLGTPVEVDFIAIDFLTQSLDESEALNQSNQNTCFTIPYQMRQMSSRLASIEETLTELKRSSMFAEAERDFCQILEQIYQIIFRDLKVKHRKKYGRFKSLSSILSAASLNREEKEDDIIHSLQAVSGDTNRSSTVEFWKALRMVKTTRNLDQHYDLRSRADAIDAVEAYARLQPQSTRGVPVDTSMLQNKTKHLILKFNIFANKDVDDENTF